jgi:alkylation response protein AidB-like acyl-CoA dehydrogenase
VGNFPTVIMFDRFGTPEQKRDFIDGMITGHKRVAFGLTEPGHGSDATWLETKAVRDGDDWVINGTKRFNSGMHHATHDLVFARTSGDEGKARGITCFVVPAQAPGLKVEYMHWTLNMPSDHAEVSFTDVRVPNEAILGQEGDGLALAQTFVHENRIRQAASGVGAAQYCINESVKYARGRVTFGQPLSARQAIQWPLAELQTECEMVRTLVYKTAWQLDHQHHLEISDKVSMCNYRANRLVCNAADQAMQVHGGMGYTRALPFEHIYRHHRRYRITEGSEEIQIRRIAQVMFGFGGRQGQG